jgi:hypothetical protein
MYNTKLNNSYDSAEDWNRDIDQPFEVDNYKGSFATSQSPKSNNEPTIYLGNSNSNKGGKSMLKSALTPTRGSRREDGVNVLMDTHMEKAGIEESSSSGFPEEVQDNRPMQRQSRRQRDEPVVERIETPPLFRGMLKNPSDEVYRDELTYGDPVASSPVRLMHKAYYHFVTCSAVLTSVCFFFLVADGDAGKAERQFDVLSRTCKHWK